MPLDNNGEVFEYISVANLEATSEAIVQPLARPYGFNRRLVYPMPHPYGSIGDKVQPDRLPINIGPRPGAPLKQYVPRFPRPKRPEPPPEIGKIREDFKEKVAKAMQSTAAVSQGPGEIQNKQSESATAPEDSSTTPQRLSSNSKDQAVSPTPEGTVLIQADNTTSSPHSPAVESPVHSATSHDGKIEDVKEHVTSGPQLSAVKLSVPSRLSDGRSDDNEDPVAEMSQALGIEAPFPSASNDDTEEDTKKSAMRSQWKGFLDALDISAAALQLQTKDSVVTPAGESMSVHSNTSMMSVRPPANVAASETQFSAITAEYVQLHHKSASGDMSEDSDTPHWKIPSEAVLVSGEITTQGSQNNELVKLNLPGTSEAMFLSLPVRSSAGNNEYPKRRPRSAFSFEATVASAARPAPRARFLTTNDPNVHIIDDIHRLIVVGNLPSSLSKAAPPTEDQKPDDRTNPQIVRTTDSRINATSPTSLENVRTANCRVADEFLVNSQTVDNTDRGIPEFEYPTNANIDAVDPWLRRFLKPAVFRFPPLSAEVDRLQRMAKLKEEVAERRRLEAEKEQNCQP